MIYVTGDTHGAFDINKINPKDHDYMQRLGHDDYLIICGDFGCVWDGGSGDRFWLNWIESLPWTTLFIDGNHENYDLLENFPVSEWHGGKVHQIRSNIYHLMRGEVYDIEGKKFFAFGGAGSHDALYRTENKSWWKRELPQTYEVKRAHENLAKNNWKVDYVLSHDIFSSHPVASRYFIDMALYGEGYEDIRNVLEEIRKRVEFQVWFNGHYHEDFVFYMDSKPIVTLFNKVVDLDHLNLNDFKSY
jgi:hypothetical protein